MNDSIHDRITEAKTSKELLLFGNEDIPWNDVFDLKDKLEVLRIQGISSGIPPELFDSLLNIRTLELTKCKLKSLSESIGKLKNLESLYLDSNSINDLPAELRNCSRLKVIVLSNNQLKHIPNILADLPQLHVLCIAGMSIKDYSNLAQLRTLRTLDLSNSRLSKIPSEVFMLNDIETLDISINQMIGIPEEISMLEKLRSLNVSQNKIRTLHPETLYRLPLLDDFQFWDNPLEAIHFFYILLPHKESEMQHQVAKWVQNIGKQFQTSGEKIEVYASGKCVRLSAPDAIALITMDSNYVSLLRTNINAESSFDLYNADERGFVVVVLGEGKKRLLADIINKGENYARETKSEDKLSRYFLYQNDPIVKTDNKEKGTLIKYEKLIKYSLAEENMYFDEYTNLKIPVNDLLVFLGTQPKLSPKQWAETDFVTQVKIQNFKIFQQCEFSLSKDCNVVLGRNGLGKTSLLQAIALGMLPRHNKDKSNEFRDYIRFGHSQADISTFWGSEFRTAYVFQNELNESVHIPNAHHLLLAYGVNLNTDPKLDHTEILEKLIAGDAESYSTKSLFKDYSVDFFDPIILLERLSGSFTKPEEKSAQHIAKIIHETLNRYLSLIDGEERMRLKKDKNGNYFFEDIAKKRLKTHNLSEGYKDHLLLILDIVIRILAARNQLFEKETPISSNLFRQVYGMILIDEFDRHMHPIWQRRLLGQLREDFSHIQFILTTHNILSLQSAEGSKALILSTSGDTVSIEEKQIEKGLSVDSVYSLYFGGENHFFSYEVQKSFEQFYELLTQMKLSPEPKVEKDLKRVVKALLKMDQEVQLIVARELKQMERQTQRQFSI